MVEEIIKYYTEGKAIEEIANKYCNSWCMAEEWSCSYPSKCIGEEYCKECWMNKIREIIEKS